jgi:hypothetical protein
MICPNVDAYQADASATANATGALRFQPAPVMASPVNYAAPHICAMELCLAVRIVSV